MEEKKAVKSIEIFRELEVREATDDDVLAVWNIIKQDSDWLSERGLHHWSKYYSQEMVAKMVARKTVLLGLVQGEPVATVTYGTKPPWYYKEPGYGERFANPADSALYMSALAVLPEEHGQGFGSRMVDMLEERAREMGTEWVRLDCRAEVPGLVSFYESRGFRRLGNEPVDEGEDGTYWLMEKQV